MNKTKFNLSTKRPVALRGVAQASSHGLTVDLSSQPDHSVFLYAEFAPRGKEWTAVAEECYKVQELKQYYTKQEKKLKDSLIALSNEEPSHGGDFVLKRIERMGAVVYKKIPVIKLMSEKELNMYRGNPTVAWKLEKK